MIPYYLRERLQRELDKMVDNDVIEEHSGPSSWVSNLVIEPKDNGGIRPTLDMRNCNLTIRKINTHTQTGRSQIIVSRISGV